MRKVARRIVSRWIPDDRSTVGHALRWPLRVIPEHRVMRVLTGPNRGFRWIAGASVHGCWLGTYERRIADLLASRLPAGGVFYDIGANAGYYTLLGSRRVGLQGQVVAFEPLPRNLSYLKRHMDMNDVTNVSICAMALLDRGGNVTLDGVERSSEATVSTDGTLVVSARALDSLALPPPDVVKMDVEGAEAMVLLGALNTLRSHRPLLLFSTHGPSVRQNCYEILTKLGYAVQSIDGQPSEHIAEPL